MPSPLKVITMTNFLVVQSHGGWKVRFVLSASEKKEVA